MLAVYNAGDVWEYALRSLVRIDHGLLRASRIAWLTARDERHNHDGAACEPPDAPATSPAHLFEDDGRLRRS